MGHRLLSNVIIGLDLKLIGSAFTYSRMLRRFPNLIRISNTVARFSAEANPIKEAPAVPKETKVQQWARFWKVLYADYKHSADDTISGIKEKPRKAAIYFGILGAAIYGVSTNPDEHSYREAVLQATDEIILISDPIRNPASEEHLKFIHSCYNQGLIRHLSLGIFSFIWMDNCDKECAVYPTQCYYLQPGLLDFHTRILDVGFFGHWWKMYHSMKDYDVNPSEASS